MGTMHCVPVMMYGPSPERIAARARLNDAFRSWIFPPASPKRDLVEFAWLVSFDLLKWEQVPVPELSVDNLGATRHLRLFWPVHHVVATVALDESGETFLLLFVTDNLKIISAQQAQAQAMPLTKLITTTEEIARAIEWYLYQEGDH